MSRTAIACTTIASVALATTALLIAGPLDPPAGQVRSSYKTLSEIEPRVAINSTNTRGDTDSLYKITQPGSYYLTGNIQGVTGKHGIEIAASGVTIDLMGFHVTGVGGSLDGISSAGGSIDHIRIVNGGVTNWGGSGIALADGSHHHVSSVRAESNLVDGIRCRRNAIVESCTASANGVDGIACLGGDALVRACGANLNGRRGISGVGGGVITGCQANQNGEDGFSTGEALVTDCTANGNTDYGFQLGIGSTITSCTAVENQHSGIFGHTGVTVNNSTARENAVNGIMVFYDSLVIGCTCASNGTNGIWAANAGNRIDGNNCVNSERGIYVDDSGSIVIRNTCSDNATNYDIVAGNAFGPISEAAGIGDLSNDATGHSWHPFANFSY